MLHIHCQKHTYVHVHYFMSLRHYVLYDETHKAVLFRNAYIHVYIYIADKYI